MRWVVALSVTVTWAATYLYGLLTGHDLNWVMAAMTVGVLWSLASVFVSELRHLGRYREPYPEQVAIAAARDMYLSDMIDVKDLEQHVATAIGIEQPLSFDPYGQSTTTEMVSRVVGEIYLTNGYVDPIRI